MKPEKQHLLHELLADEPRREATLIAAAKILRHRRQWHTVRHTLPLILLAAVIALLVQPHRPPQRLPPVSHYQARSPAPQPTGALTDDELLALFPNTPVGLATLPNGRKLLIFPRPGDETKFITRL